MLIVHWPESRITPEKRERRGGSPPGPADDGVVSAACRDTMEKNKVAREELLPFVTTVDSGVAEVVRKQEAG